MKKLFNERVIYLEVPKSKESDAVEALSKSSVPYKEYESVPDLVSSKALELVFEDGKEAKEKIKDAAKTTAKTAINIILSSKFAK